MRRLYDLKLLRSRTPFFALSRTVMHPIDAAATLGASDLEMMVTPTGIDEIFAQPSTPPFLRCRGRELAR